MKQVILESARGLFGYIALVLSAVIAMALIYWPVTFVVVTVLFVTKCST